MHLELIRAPPYYIFVGRGDIFHAGCSFEENGGTGGLRYHLYFVTRSSSLPDGVHLLQYFRPLPRNSWLGQFWCGVFLQIEFDRFQKSALFKYIEWICFF